MTNKNQPPPLLKGFRDFLPEEKRKRDYVASKIKETFELFGFEPLETPTLEYASLLLGKYGTEADKLIYTFKDKGDREVGLRYDQTVPTARVIAENQNPEVLLKILRRYQIQNVFRSEKPQKGRYREFTQCDIDIFGSNSPITDGEILACTYFAYKNIGFDEIRIALNDRETLFAALQPFASPLVSVFSIIQTIDKLDKLSEEEVIGELVKKGLEGEAASASIQAIQSAKRSERLRKIEECAINLGMNRTDIVFTPNLARGLDYYTGMIFEVKTPHNLSSLGGGGRYDNLIEQLCGISIAAVGMAIGFDRTVEEAEQAGLIPQAILSPTAKVLIAVFENTVNENLVLAKKLREKKINVEVFGDQNARLDKQLKYADKKGIPYAAILGPEEVAAGTVTIKDLRSGSQKTIAADKLLDEIY